MIKTRKTRWADHTEEQKRKEKHVEFGFAKLNEDLGAYGEKSTAIDLKEI
jgi:hypothetical protein